VLDNTFSAGHKIEEVRVENHKSIFISRRRRFSFYEHGDFEQISLNKNILDSPDLRKKEMLW
jgi:elongation factor P